MMYTCLEHVILYTLPAVTITTISICLTWNVTSNHITIKCAVRNPTSDIFIFDPFGTNRVQCIFGRPSCTHLFELKTTASSKTMMITIDKDNAEGEWKCLHGNEERKTRVTYKESPPFDIHMSGEQRQITRESWFKLNCSSCWKPFGNHVSISVNGVLEDIIRLDNGLCYHKRSLCSQGKCTCEEKGRHFTWNFISNLTYIHFKCSMTFFDKQTSVMTRATAYLIYNESVFIQTQSTNSVKINFEDPKNGDNSNNDLKDQTSTSSGLLAYSVFGIILGLIISMLLMICVCRKFHSRKKFKRRKSNKQETAENFIK